MRVSGWHPEVIREIAEEATKEQFDEAAQTVAQAVRRRCPVGTVSRALYRRGPYAGQYWTARDAGALRKSVRVVRGKDKSGGGMLIFRAADVRVYIGHKKAFYASIVEHYTPFVRPALDGVLSRVKDILGAR